MTGPLGNREFCFPEILGKQNSLFPSGPVIKCLLLTDLWPSVNRKLVEQNVLEVRLKGHKQRELNNQVINFFCVLTMRLNFNTVEPPVATTSPQRPVFQNAKRFPIKSLCLPLVRDRDHFQNFPLCFTSRKRTLDR